MNQLMNKPSYTDRKTFLRSEIFKYSVSALILVLGFGLMMFLKSFAKPPADRESTSLVAQVDVQEVVAYAGNLDLEVSGTVVPYREIRVAAEVGGRVTNKTAAFEAGNFVSKGDVLLEIDPEEYRLEIQTQQANLDQAKRRVEENQKLIEGELNNIRLAEADVRLQRATNDRNRRLKNVLSKSELDQSNRALIAAESQLTLRRTNLSSLQAAAARLAAAVELAERQVEKANLNLRRATVVAPEDGVIVKEMVQEGDFVNRGTQLLTFEDTRQAEVLCNLTTSELNQIRKYAADTADDRTGSGAANGSAKSPLDNRSVYRLPPTPVTIIDPAMPDVTWMGTLERFDGIGVDSVTKTIPCRISIDQPIVESDNGSVALVRGMFVKCRLEFRVSSGSGSQKYVVLPEQAVHPNSHVWLVENDQLKRKDVRIVDRVATDLVNDTTLGPLAVLEQTESGPKPGDWVVVSPLSQPSENAVVEVAVRNGQEVQGQQQVESDKSSSAATVSEP